MRKFTKLLALSAATMIFPSAASAVDWRMVYVEIDDALVFFDADSIVKEGETIEVWVKTVRLKKPFLNGAWGISVRKRHDCQRRTGHYMAFVNYDYDGTYKSSEKGLSSSNYVPPGSIEETLLNVFCTAGFPGDKSGSVYGTESYKDVFKARSAYLKYLLDLGNSAP
jgi:hypothetical protein